MKLYNFIGSSIIFTYLCVINQNYYIMIKKILPVIVMLLLTSCSFKQKYTYEKQTKYIPDNSFITSKGEFEAENDSLALQFAIGMLLCTISPDNHETLPYKISIMPEDGHNIDVSFSDFGIELATMRANVNPSNILIIGNTIYYEK